MLPQEIIRKKRDGQELTDEAIAFVVRGITDGSLSESSLQDFGVHLISASVPGPCA